jgi:hypothetical protein
MNGAQVSMLFLSFWSGGQGGFNIQRRFVRLARHVDMAEKHVIKQAF